MIEYDAQHSKLLASCDHRKETLFAFQFYSFWFSLSPCLILDGSQSTVQSLSLYRFSFFATCVVVRLDSRSSVGRAVYYYYYYSVHRKRQPFPMSKHMSIPGNHLHTIDGVFFLGELCHRAIVHRKTKNLEDNSKEENSIVGAVILVLIFDL